MSDPPKRIGRPRLDPDDPASTHLNVRVTSKQFDALYRVASRRRLSVSEVVRTACGALLRRERLEREREP